MFAATRAATKLHAAAGCAAAVASPGCRQRRPGSRRAAPRHPQGRRTPKSGRGAKTQAVVWKCCATGANGRFEGDPTGKQMHERPATHNGQQMRLAHPPAGRCEGPPGAAPPPPHRCAAGRARPPSQLRAAPAAGRAAPGRACTGRVRGWLWPMTLPHWPRLPAQPGRAGWSAGCCPQTRLLRADTTGPPQLPRLLRRRRREAQGPQLPARAQATCLPAGRPTSAALRASASRPQSPPLHASGPPPCRRGRGGH